MAVSSFASGTYSSTAAFVLASSVGSGGCVSAVSTAGTFTFHVDLTNMAAGDWLELRIAAKVASNTTTPSPPGWGKVVYYQQYRNAQSSDNIVQISVPISNDLLESNALTFYITQNNARNIPWKVLQYI